MSDPGEVLEERPDLEPALRAVVAADEGADAWRFDEVAADSGAFGELVSRDVVERTGDGRYRLADAAAARAALDSEVAEAGSNRDPSVSLSFPAVEVESRVAAALAGALAVVAVFRLVTLPSVFQNGDVVLPGNDPYYYRYWVERAAAAGSLDLSTVLNLPEAVTTGEPLMVATLWWVTSLLGGGAATAGHVLAWYPVVSAVITGLFVYLLARELADDVRVGLAAVLLLAITPGHALRTGIGFADHHAFDYPWLALTALALVVLVRSPLRRGQHRWRPSRRVVLAAGALAAGVACQVLAWEAGPLLLVPIAVTVAVGAVIALRAGESPALVLVPTATGLALAALLAAAVHIVAGWQRPEVAFVPALLFVGAVGVGALGEAIARLDLPAEALVGAEAVGAVVGVVGTWFLLPDVWARLTREFGRLFGQRNIVEVQPLFSAGTFGWLFLFGFVLVVAVPYLAWATWRARADRGWLAAAAYGWWLLILAAIQMRFAGELSAFAAVFAGLGLVHLAERVDLARPPAPFADGGRGDRLNSGAAITSFGLPDRETAVSFIVLFLLVGSIGAIQTPVKAAQVSIDDGTYEMAKDIEAYAEERDMAYPKNYVLSKWWRNRVYNYFVSGESRSYGYARQNFAAFRDSTEPETWYDRFVGRVGFVVLEDGHSAPLTTHARLYRHHGSRNGEVPGMGHYRLIAVQDDAKAFAVVPGANLTGTASPNATLDVTADVRVDIADEPVRFTYERRVETGPDGQYHVIIAYPGEYTIGNQTATVPEAAVEDGRTVEVGG